MVLWDFIGIEYLLNKGYNVNHVDRGNNSALKIALYCNIPEIITLLLENWVLDPIAGFESDEKSPYWKVRKCRLSLNILEWIFRLCILSSFIITQY